MNGPTGGALIAAFAILATFVDKAPMWALCLMAAVILAATVVVCAVTLRLRAHIIDHLEDGTVACRKCGPGFLCTEIR